MKNIQELLNLSNNELKDVRTTNALKNIASISEQKIQNKIIEFRNKRMELDSIIDLGDDETTSIATKIRKINAADFVSSVYNYAEELVILARSINIAVSLHNQLFTNTIKGLDADDIDGLEEAIYPTRS